MIIKASRLELGGCAAPEKPNKWAQILRLFDFVETNAQYAIIIIQAFTRLRFCIQSPQVRAFHESSACKLRDHQRAKHLLVFCSWNSAPSLLVVTPQPVCLNIDFSYHEQSS
ncbi:unnamed protein product [Durusdinium trenchii]|uniref:Uncharacterized protein n=1 Tax=Durusdinium trenchii TaxID=1381693 RepID=A0ABP0Q5Y2_9DINO